MRLVCNEYTIYLTSINRHSLEENFFITFRVRTNLFFCIRAFHSIKSSTYYVKDILTCEYMFIICSYIYGMKFTIMLLMFYPHALERVPIHICEGLYFIQYRMKTYPQRLTASIINEQDKWFLALRFLFSPEIKYTKNCLISVTNSRKPTWVSKCLYRNKFLASVFSIKSDNAGFKFTWNSVSFKISYRPY